MEILNTLGIHRKNLTRKLHHIRKIFGPLRNIHIELEAIKNFENQNDVHLRPFRKYLERREKNVMKKLLRELEEISVSKQELEFKKLVRKLIDNDTPQTNDKALIKIEDIHRIAYTEFKNKLQALSPNSKKSIHAVRIAAKKLRYQFEILKPAMNLKEINLQKLRLIQDKYGEIQNNFVLQNSIKKYLHKYCPKGCISVLKLQTSVAQEYLIHIAYVRKMKKHSA
jgi:CHAD domain-containing protein